MLPILHFDVPTYGVFATIGLIFSVVYTFLRTYSINLKYKHFLLYLLMCLICGAVFARVMFVIAMIPQVGLDFRQLCEYLINGGIVFYGGLFGVLLGIVITSKILKRESKKMLDFFAPAFPLFHFWGRLGCLFAGCCYGIVWPWGVILADDPNVVRFPVQFFEALGNLAIFLIISRRIKKKGTDEFSLYYYLLMYSVLRFILEFFRGDVERGIWLNCVSTAQIISVVVFVIVTLKLVKQGKRKNYAT